MGETLQAKHAYEKFATDFAIKQRFRADNALFRSAEFLINLELNGQTIDYSGVGKYNPNGVAAQALQTATKLERTALLPQMLQWPEQSSPSSWPCALEHAIHIWNHLSSHHCFVYVLDPRFKMTRSYQSGELDHVLECMLDHLTAPFAPWERSSTWLPEQSRHSFT